jgi:hypothetical protein
MLEYFDAITENSYQRLVLQIVGVDVIALGDIGDELADVLAIFDRGVARLDVLERDLVADRHIRLGETSAKVELSCVTTHSMSVPAVRPSTTTTPTLSACSWTRRWGISPIIVSPQ